MACRVLPEDDSVRIEVYVMVVSDGQSYDFLSHILNNASLQIWFVSAGSLSP